MIGRPSSPAACATGDGVSTRLRPIGASARVTTPTTLWADAARARSEGTAGAGVPAKGLTGSGYSGHYFWDTEVYVLPFLAYTTPRWARNALATKAALMRARSAWLSSAGARSPS